MLNELINRCLPGKRYWPIDFLHPSSPQIPWSWSSLTTCSSPFKTNIYWTRPAPWAKITSQSPAPFNSGTSECKNAILYILLCTKCILRKLLCQFMESERDSGERRDLRANGGEPKIWDLESVQRSAVPLRPRPDPRWKTSSSGRK